MTKLIIVNDKDEVIGQKEKGDRTEDDIIRVAGLWVFNGKKEALIAQRANDKLHDPSKWGPSVTGTLEEGETYVSNIIKEAREEIDLTLQESELIYGPHRFVSTSHQYFYQSFFAKADFPISAFTIQHKEVAEIRWVPIDDLLKWVRKRPEDFIASFRSSEASLYDFAKFLSAT